MITFLKLFGIERVQATHYYLLCKNTNTGTIYFRCFDKGVADFTIYKQHAWKFTEPEKARSARTGMGLFNKDMYIEEIKE